MEPSTIVRHSPKATFRKLADGSGGVVLHLDTAQYHGLNDVGCLIWNAIGDGSTMADLVTGVRIELLDPPPNLDDDVAEFVGDLEKRGLVILESPR